MCGHIFGGRRGKLPPRLLKNRLFDHRKVRMSRNEVKNREKNQWGLLCKCPLSGQATAGISWEFNANRRSDAGL
ncbi:hypothetical protein PRCB_09665 [Pantoea rodasii]|uniref:Uncharacterized protein n=1 Tax=Pantoea rodasii TaxID=1076549 RepID=A0A2M9WDQ0_9GAMM|nr:hypothetical protein PRCB_09665 [Pantoea rodasii]